MADKPRGQRSVLLLGLVAPLLLFAFPALAQTCLAWEKALPDGGRGAAAFDTDRGRVLLASPPTGGQGSLETLEWDGLNWNARATTGPSTRTDHRMVYDSARHVAVLFGGFLSQSRSNETWEWDGQSWSLRATNGPSARFRHAMAYDAARGVTLLYGGDSDTGQRDDMWSWNGTAWTQISVSTPGPRSSHSMAYDAERGVVMSLGGESNANQYDVFEWDGVAWTQRNRAPMSGRGNYLVFDTGRRQLVAGGFDARDLAAFDGQNWTVTSLPAGPSFRSAPIVAFDAARTRLVLFSGSGSFGQGSVFFGDTWERDGLTWTRIIDAPSSGRNQPMAFDSAHSESIMFGGVINTAELLTHTWSWNGRTWERLATSGPPARFDHNLTYDSVRDRVVLFGGSLSGLEQYGDTWLWNGSTRQWSLSPATGPSSRSRFAIAFDELRGETIMFGGSRYDPQVGRIVYLRDTWRFNGTQWTLASSTGPAVRDGAAMAYDADRQRMVLFGGSSVTNGSTTRYADTWEWTGTSWLSRSTTGPAARELAGIAYDRSRRVTVMFGGNTAGGSVNELWQWNGSTWQRVNIASPLPRFAPSMAYDTARQVTVLFGAAGGTSLGSTDTWELRGNLALGSEPISRTASRGETTVFSATVQSSSPFTLRWRRNGVPLSDGPRLSGTTTNTLTITNIVDSDGGVYDLVVTDQCGSTVTSRAAELTVRFAVEYTIGRSFTASTFLADSDFFPPDTMGAVGPSHFVEILNGRYSVYDKATGTRVDTRTLNDFWAAAGAPRFGPFAFDPRVAYDPYSQRWFAVSCDNPHVANNFLVAVSNSANPLDGWRGYRVDSDIDDLTSADFPMLAITQDSIVVTANMFPAFPTAFFHTSVLVISKADLVAGVPSPQRRLMQTSANSTGATPQPVRSLDNSPQRLILSSYNKLAGTLKRSSITGSLPLVSVNTDGGFYTVVARDSPEDAPQPSGVLIDTGDSRFGGEVVQLGGSLWAVHSVRIDGRAALEWYELDAATSAVRQSGVVTDPLRHFYFPSLAVNPAGNMVIGFSGSSPIEHASAYCVVGRTVAGTMQVGPPILLRAGADSYNQLDSIGRNRWGDYSATTVDPTDPFRFWTIQEWCSAPNQWSTQVTELVFPGATDLCRPDFNRDGALDPDDLADYIGVFFAEPADVRADFDGNGAVDPDDLADYIGAYFLGC